MARKNHAKYSTNGRSNKVAVKPEAVAVEDKPFVPQQSNFSVTNHGEGRVTESRVTENTAPNTWVSKTVVKVPSKNLTYTFIGRGETAQAAEQTHKYAIDNIVSFWRYLLGENKSQEKFANVPVLPVEIARKMVPQVVTGNCSNVVAAMAYNGTQTGPALRRD